MKRQHLPVRLLLLVILITLMFGISLSTQAQADPNCQGSLVARLKVGDTGEIAERYSTLRSVPGGTGTVIYAPARFTVLEGPVCAANGPLNWYRIEYENGRRGWASESQVNSQWGSLYWLRPVSSPAPTEEPTAEVTAEPTEEPTPEVTPEPTDEPTPDPNSRDAGQFLPLQNDPDFTFIAFEELSEVLALLIDLFPDGPFEFFDSSIGQINDVGGCIAASESLAGGSFTSANRGDGLVVVFNEATILPQVVDCLFSPQAEIPPQEVLCLGTGRFLFGGDNYSYGYAGYSSTEPDSFCSAVEAYYADLETRYPTE